MKKKMKFQKKLVIKKEIRSEEGIEKIHQIFFMRNDDKKKKKFLKRNINLKKL